MKVTCPICEEGEVVKIDFDEIRRKYEPVSVEENENGERIAKVEFIESSENPYEEVFIRRVDGYAECLNPRCQQNFEVSSAGGEINLDKPIEIERR